MTMEKIKKKANKNKRKSIQDDGSSLRSEATSAGESLISVKEAALEDQADNTSPVKNRPSSGQSSDVNRRVSGQSLVSAVSPGPSTRTPTVNGNQVAPLDNSASVTASAASLQSREAWSDSGHQNGRRTSTSHRAVESDIMAVAEVNGAQAYVPYSYARDRIGLIMDDMRKLKSSHVTIVHGIENNYRKIEDETQLQFNVFVMSLRDQYGQKVIAFRHVIDVHRQELQQKQQYWDAALLSLSERNRQLLADKKTLLIQNKIEFEKLESERDTSVHELSSYLDKKNKADLDRTNQLTRQLKEEESQNQKLVDEKRVEKDERDKLLVIISDLKDRKDAVVAREEAPTQTAAVAVTTSVLVPTEMSDDERRLMEEERRRIGTERARMEEERREEGREREESGEERRRLQAAAILLQGRLTDTAKDRDVWKAKYEASRPQLDELASLRVQHDALRAQYAAVALVAVATTADDRRKTDEIIAKTESDKAMMVEQRQQLEEDVAKWEKKFRKKKGREPDEADREESASELYASLGEANAMIGSLDHQIETLETVGRGEVPPAPLVVPVTARQTEVKVIEVIVPDPEVLAQLEMTQAELEAMRRQLLAVKDKERHLHGEKSQLHAELARVKGEVARLQADVLELEAFLAGRSQSDDLQAKLQDVQERLQNEQKSAVATGREMKKQKREADNKEEQQREDKRQLEDLLAVVVSQVKEVHGEERGASLRIEERLHHAEERRREDTEAEEGKRTEKLVIALNMIQTGSVPSSLRTASATVTDERAKEMEKLEEQVSELEQRLAEVNIEKASLDESKEELQEQVDALTLQMSRRPSLMSPLVVPTQGDDVDVEDLLRQVDDLQTRADALEGSWSEEQSNHDMTRDELEATREELRVARSNLQRSGEQAAASLEEETARVSTELERTRQRLSEKQRRVAELEQERLKDVPVDAAREITHLTQKLGDSENTSSSLEADKAELSAKLKAMKVKLRGAEEEKTHQLQISSDLQGQMSSVKTGKLSELKHQKQQFEKKEKHRSMNEAKKVEILEKKIFNLQMAGGVGSAKGKGADAKTLQVSLEKLRDMKKENGDLNARLKQAEAELKKGGSQPSADIDKVTKRHEKILKELEKRLDFEKKKNEKNDENLHRQDEQLKGVNKDNHEKDKEIAKMRHDLSTLGLAAKEGIESAKRVESLKSDVKRLTEENKAVADSFNSERILRKKYYNMVEDMKGKIRVYCRVRPLSKSELDRKNVSVVKSPDEYSIVVNHTRGVKEFQYDSIFMPDASQDAVFEDTNNLIQSAVDGYNVCIFAYGQTGSGKTFTIIGDTAQQHPGIAPRAFNRVFELVDENKHKFKSTITCYMLELYNEKLLDLFLKPGAEPTDMDIKKDKKGLVWVHGAEVKVAKNAKHLFALFEQGSKTRHTASTMMNAESSRSHLVISIIIEMVSLTSGQVLKGKLSLVDLAGSERVGKTGATAQQLKEAMSINKSLSALGDVISALSSEQDFIPYRNNKLTMLMQDSLGGNAKTLMFVNVSPADYNMDETVVSLVYASRVKLITNDAQKNSDNKEIAKLKAVIMKMKQGDLVASADYE